MWVARPVNRRVVGSSPTRGAAQSPAYGLKMRRAPATGAFSEPDLYSAEGSSAPANVLLSAPTSKEAGVTVAGATGMLLRGERVTDGLRDLAPGLRPTRLVVRIRRAEERLGVLSRERADRACVRRVVGRSPDSAFAFPFARSCRSTHRRTQNQPRQSHRARPRAMTSCSLLPLPILWMNADASFGRHVRPCTKRLVERTPRHRDSGRRRAGPTSRASAGPVPAPC